jgi:8-oxo-dGTP pyrophosphatase MutT (NUDIX family)
MMKNGAGIILIKDGKVLLVQPGAKSLHLEGTVAIPGGHIEDGETPEEAARREFTEETGLVVGSLTEFPNNYVEDKIVRKDGLIDYSFKVYLAADYTGNLLVDSDDERPVWVDVNEARKMKLWANNNLLLENALRFLNSKHD